MNTRAGEVLAEKVSKCVANICPGDKGETVSVLVCCKDKGV